MNTDLILHHYDSSPFAQKIRSIFGYCDLSWNSVLSPPMPPRPNLDPLTGGYRKIPVLQIGADLFCDTRIITAELAALTNSPTLDRAQCSADIQNFIDDVDLRVFFASAGSAPPLKALGALLKSFGPLQTLKFIKDRVNMVKTSKVPMPSGAKAQSILKPHYQKLDTMLADQPFLFGEEISIADFSAYHVTWLANLTGANPLSDSSENTLNWYNRITDFGDGNKAGLDAQQAFTIARDNNPRALPRNSKKHESVGKQAQIAPSDYGRDPVMGTLVASTEQRWVIARETPEFGKLHVHFPKQGFELRPLG